MSPKSIPAKKTVPSLAETSAPPETEPASTSASAEAESSADAPASEPVIVNTAIHPDNNPDPTKGTVTDPDILRRHGIEPKGEPAAEKPEEVELPAPEKPTGEGQIWRCIAKSVPTGHPDFRSDAHLQDPPRMPKCPVCGNINLRRVDG